MKSQTRVLKLDKIQKTYQSPTGPHTVLDEIDLTVQSGETVAIVGPSGSGKSTLLNIIGSLDRPTAGEVTLGDVNVAALEGDDLAKFRACEVGFIFQDHHLLPQLTAHENVVLPTLAAQKAGNEHADAEERARALLDRVGVAERSDAFPARLSGGERQRVAIARAMINQPKLLLCDEPSGNLDQETASGVISLFLELAREQEVTVLMVTHNLEHARLFSRSLELKHKTLEEQGRTS